MKYVKSLIPLAAICLLCFGCEPTSLIQSSRQTTVYNINQPEDLTGDTSKSVHGEQNVLYSVSNDKANLYVTLMVADPKTQSKFLSNGFTLWIDTTGNKKRSLGISYPLTAKGNKESQPGNRKKGESRDQDTYENRSMQMETKRRMILTMIDMELIGYEGKVPQRVSATSNVEGIRVGLLIDSNGALQYHAIIPFATMHYHPAMHQSRPITVALSTSKEETKPAGEKGSHGGAPVPGPGGMGGGGMGGHGGGGGGYSDPANEPVDVWMHVKLSGY